jgi:hypothetical protein
VGPAYYFLVSPFDPEDEKGMFLRNVCEFLLDYTTSQKTVFLNYEFQLGFTIISDINSV